jgi:hypothetical protein
MRDIKKYFRPKNHRRRDDEYSVMTMTNRLVTINPTANRDDSAKNEDIAVAGAIGIALVVVVRQISIT